MLDGQAFREGRDRKFLSLASLSQMIPVRPRHHPPPLAVNFKPVADLR